MIELNEQDGDVLLSIKVVPNASRDRLAGELDGALKVQITAPPEKGAANKAVCKLIAQKLGLRNQAVRIDAGQTSPHKTVRIVGQSANIVRRGLGI